MTFTFNTKETYLAYRAQWKAQYKKLSADIRQAKLDLKKAQRENTVIGQHFLCLKLKAQARQMLDERVYSKMEAQRQWLAQRNPDGPTRV